jgi:hypothetical protein
MPPGLSDFLILRILRFFFGFGGLAQIISSD